MIQTRNKRGCARAGVIVAGILAVLANPLGAFAAGDHAEEGAGERAGALRALWQRAVEELEQASDAREPPLVAPVPRPVNWQARRISSIDLGAPLLALSTGDIDGDGRADIIALTARELVVVEHRGRRDLQVRARIELPGKPAAIRPRETVGTLVVADLDGDGALEIAARSSERERAAVFELRDGALVEVEARDGFPVCPHLSADLDPGRNYFAAVHERTPELENPAGQASAPPPRFAALRAAVLGGRLERFFAARCRDGLFDTAGRDLMVAGILANDGTLHLWSERRCPRRDQACRQDALSSRTLADNGTAFEIADIDNDGHPEVVVSAATPPGEADRVTVLSWRGDRLQGVFQRSFSGGVAGLSAGDLDGDGTLELLAAVRLSGSHRVDLWIFNR